MYITLLTWTFLTLNMDKNSHFWTTYPPLLVYVVFEGPQTCNCLPFHRYSIILNTTHFYHNCVQKTKNVSLFPFLLRIFCFLDQIGLKRNEQLAIFDETRKYCKNKAQISSILLFEHLSHTDPLSISTWFLKYRVSLDFFSISKYQV